MTWPHKDPYHHSINTIAAVAERLSLKFEYIGNWNHPRGQQLSRWPSSHLLRRWASSSTRLGRSTSHLQHPELPIAPRRWRVSICT